MALPLPMAAGSLETYIQSVNRFPLLSAEQELDYARRYQHDGDLDAARQLVLSHLRLVVAVARGYLGYGLPHADLIQEGNIGLMKAVKRFDPARGIDVLIADTAGRLATQLHLMEEIRKVKRVLAKALPGAPHEVLLVLDANTGQNALAQVKAFDEALGLTGLVLTKLDGTAKGGVVCAIARERPVPLLFIGVGEGIDDLRPFAAAEFAGALVD
jgi:hypothetical protein